MWPFDDSGGGSDDDRRSATPNRGLSSVNSDGMGGYDVLGVEHENGQNTRPSKQTPETKERYQQVSELVAEILDSDGGERLSGVIATLQGTPTERNVSARALARVAQQDPEVLQRSVDEFTNQLVDLPLSRPIAELFLSGTHDIYGVDPANIAAGAVLGLQLADEKIAELAQQGNTVPGGGATENIVAQTLQDREHTDDSVQEGLKLTAEALYGVPIALAQRAEMDWQAVAEEMVGEYHAGNLVGIDTEYGDIRDATGLSMEEIEYVVRARITDGIALGVVLYRTQGTTSQLETLTGYEPYPE